MKRSAVIGFVVLLIIMNIYSLGYSATFRYPVGDETGTGWLLNRTGLQWLDSHDYGGTCGTVFHPGTDFNKDGTSIDGDLGEPVYAIYDGIVQESYYEGGSTWGNLVLIKHSLQSGETFFALYGHLDQRLVAQGDFVLRGEKIGTVGKGVNLPAHLHFEVRKNTLNGRSAKFYPCGISGYDKSFVAANYYDPEVFIKNFGNIGSYSDGFHTDGTSQSFVDEFNKNNLKIGWPTDDGGGPYVHKWQAEYNYRVWIQNYHGDINTDHFGTDGQTAIILNSHLSPYKAYLVKEGMWGYYKINDGPYNLGEPFTDELHGTLAFSYDNLSSDPIHEGDYITVQKFMRVYDGLAFDPERRTLIWKPGIDVQHFAVGEFAIWPENCADNACYKEGDQIYVMDVNNYSGSNDKPWPRSGVTVTAKQTTRWFTKPGTYTLIKHDAFGKRIQGSGRIVEIFEGNHQFSGDASYKPLNLSASAESISTIRLTFILPGGTDGFNVRIYQDGQKIKDIPAVGNVLIDNLVSGTNYCFQVTAFDNSTGQETGVTSSVCTSTYSISASPPVQNPPTALFSSSVTGGLTPLQVTFTDQSTGVVSSWTWSFGDGTSSSLQNPQHTYQSAGVYSVTLTVSGSGGTITSQPQTFTVTNSTPACTYSLPQYSQSVPASGGTYSVSVATSASNCAWKATPSDTWISISSTDNGTASGTITYTVAMNTSVNLRSASVNISGSILTINQAGYDPNSIAARDTLTLLMQDTSKSVALNATDTNGLQLTYKINTNPVHGTLLLIGSAATYTPAAGFVGDDSFTYVASDGISTSSPATARLSVVSATTSGPLPLYVEGVLVKDSTGKTVKLRSINFDHFMEFPFSQETTTGFHNSLLWMHTKEDYLRVKIWGLNCVRLLISPANVEDPFAFGNLKDQVKWAKEAGLYLIISYATPTGSVAEGDSYTDKPFWDGIRNADGKVNVSSPQFASYQSDWQMITSQFKNDRHVIFELIHEPQLHPDWSDISLIPTSQTEALYSDFLKKTIQTVRNGESPDNPHLIIIDGLAWAAALPRYYRFIDNLAGYDPDLMYSFHYYKPEAFVWQGCTWNAPICDQYRNTSSRFVTTEAGWQQIEYPLSITDFSKRTTSPLLKLVSVSQPGTYYVKTIELIDSDGNVKLAEDFNAKYENECVNIDPSSNKACDSGRLIDRNNQCRTWSTVSNLQWNSAYGGSIGLAQMDGGQVLKMAASMNKVPGNASEGAWIVAQLSNWNTDCGPNGTPISLESGKTYKMRLTVKGEGLTSQGFLQVALNSDPTETQPIWQKEINRHLSSDIDMVQTDINQMNGVARQYNVPMFLGEFRTPVSNLYPDDTVAYLETVTSAAENDDLGWSVYEYGDFATNITLTTALQTTLNALGRMVINKGASMTNTPSVNLALNASNNAVIVGYYASELATVPTLSSAVWSMVTPTAFFSANVSFTLSGGDGIKTIHSWLKDATGSILEMPSASILLDTIAPPVPSITLPTDNMKSNNAMITVSGTAEGKSIVEVLDGIISMGTVTTRDNGTWSMSAGILKEGSHAFSARSTDMAGNISPLSMPISIIIDLTAPVTTVTPAGGTYDAAQTVTLVSSEFATIYYTTDGSTPTTTSQIYADPIAVPLSTVLKFFSIDAAGNIETVKTDTFIINDEPVNSQTVPDGDLDGGGVTVTDAQRALRIAAGLIAPSANDLAYGDVAPLVNGKPQPDGRIDIGDVVVILRRVVNLTTW